MDNIKDDKYYLQKMLDIIEYLESYYKKIQNSNSVMKPNDPNSDAILYKFIQLREEAKNLSKNLLSSNSVLSEHIKFLTQFRNRITHDYDSVSYNYFDEIFDSDLPSLKREIAKALKK